MDILIGTFNLTRTQQDNFVTLNVPPFKGVCYNNKTKELYAVSENQPTQQEIDAMVSAVNALDVNPSKQVLEATFDVNQFLIELEDALGESASDDLASHVRRVERYADRADFGKIKRLGERLVQKGEMTQQQFDGMSALFLSKGIDLNNY